ncbi:MAG: hypothetical protein II458_01890 [Oscillospiraceae bacterium]|nr:hypothetical protein [Oscillospiraceae bacterium]
MKVMVVGKEYVSGTSKRTGKAFESNVAYVTHKKNGVTGVAVDSVWLDPEQHPLGSIQVGKEYSIDRDNRGFLLSFDPV